MNIEYGSVTLIHSIKQDFQPPISIILHHKHLFKISGGY